MSAKDRMWVESGNFALPSQVDPPRFKPYAWIIFPLYALSFIVYCAYLLKPPFMSLSVLEYPRYGLLWLWELYRNYPTSHAATTLLFYRFMPSFFLVCLVYGALTYTDTEDKLSILEGSAHWASREEITRAGLLNGVGVYVGGWLDKAKNKILPLQHNGPEHVMAVAPTRSGKGVSLVVPTLLTWQHSVFVLDIKGENWLLSAGWRNKELGQPVFRFDPSDSSERGAHYNPLEEIHFREDGGSTADEEARDVQTIASLLVDPDGKGLEDHWAKTAFILLQGAILHMVYKGRREGKIYSLKDVRDCLTHGDNKGLAAEWLLTPHLKEGWDIKRTNMWQATWDDIPTGYRGLGENDRREREVSHESGFDAERERYEQERRQIAEMVDVPPEDIEEFTSEFAVNFSEEDEVKGPGSVDSPEEEAQEEGQHELPPKEIYGIRLKRAKAEREALGPSSARSFKWDKVRPFIDEDGLCYTHPTVVAVATEIGNKDVREASSIISTAISFLGLWLDPVVELNTAKSTFHLRDLVDGEKPASLYLVVPPSGLTRLRPLLRLVVSQLVFSLTPPMVEKEDGSGVKSANKHRMLLMLDEFPTLAKLELVQSALAYLGGYGVKSYIIIQSYKQLTDIYGQDETVSGNCHIHVAFAPNDESTAKALSERCGKTTIITGSSNISGKRFALQSFFKDSESIQYASHGRELLTPDECKRLPTAVKDEKGLMTKPGNMLTFAAGCAPIMGVQTPWFFDKELTRRCRILAPKKSSVVVQA